MSLYDTLLKIKQDSEEKKRREQQALTTGAQAGVDAMSGFTGMPAPEIKTPGYEIIKQPDPKPMEWNTLKEIGGTIGRVPGQTASQLLGMGAFVTGSEDLAKLSTLAGEKARHDFPTAAPQISSWDDLSNMSIVDLAKYGLSESGQVAASMASLAIPGAVGKTVLMKLAPAVSKVAAYSPKIAKLVQAVGGVEKAAEYAAAFGGSTLLEAGSITTDAYESTGEMPERLKVLPWAIAAGALESLEPVMLLNRFGSKVGGEVAEMAAKKTGQRLVNSIIDYSKDMGLEGGTEFLQTLIEESAVENIRGTPAIQAWERTVTNPDAMARAIGAGFTGSIGGGVARGSTDLLGAVARAQKEVPAEPVIVKPVETKPVDTPAPQPQTEQQIPLPTEPTQPTEPEPEAEKPQPAEPQPSEAVKAPDVGAASSAEAVKVKKMAKNVTDAMQAIGIQDVDGEAVRMTGKRIGEMTLPELQQVNDFVLNQLAMGNTVGPETPTMPPVAPPTNLNQAIQMAQRPEIRQPTMPQPQMSIPGTAPMTAPLATARMTQPQRTPIPQTGEVTRPMTPEDIAPFADQPEPEEKPMTREPRKQEKERNSDREIKTVLFQKKDGSTIEVKTVYGAEWRGANDQTGEPLASVIDKETGDIKKTYEGPNALDNAKRFADDMNLELALVAQPDKTIPPKPPAQPEPQPQKAEGGMSLEELKSMRMEIMNRIAEQGRVVDARLLERKAQLDKIIEEEESTREVAEYTETPISEQPRAMSDIEKEISGIEAKKKQINSRKMLPPPIKNELIGKLNDRLQLLETELEQAKKQIITTEEDSRKQTELYKGAEIIRQSEIGGGYSFKAKIGDNKFIFKRDDGSIALINAKNATSFVNRNMAENAVDLYASEKPTVTKPAYGSENTIVTKDRYEELKKRFKDKTKNITSGVDPELMTIAVEMATYHIEAGVRKFADFVKAVIDDVGEEFRPYLKSAYLGAKYYPGSEKFRSEMSAEAEVNAYAEEQPAQQSAAPAETKTPAQSLLPFVKTLLTTSANNRNLDAIVKEAGLDLNRKQAQEAIEGAITMLIREQNLYGDFHKLNTIYKNMPNLSERTGKSMTNQAYSTPHILSSLLVESLDLPNKTISVYEPTAGNGLLLSGVVENSNGTRNNYFLNELDEKRAATLEELFPEADLTIGDATTSKGPAIDVDLVMANPPFGSIEDTDVTSVQGERGEITLSKLEHLIAWNAIKHMKKDGKAVLILGAEKENKITGARKRFATAIYNQYNIAGHFELDGQLYRKMGAEWPIEVYVIEGRKDYPRSRDLIKAPEQVRRLTHEDGWIGVKNYIEGNVKTGQYINRATQPDGGRGSRDNQRQSERDDTRPAMERSGEDAQGEREAGTGTQPVSAELGTTGQPVQDRGNDTGSRRNTERVERVKRTLADEGKGRQTQPRDATTPDTRKSGVDDTRIESEQVGSSDSFQEDYKAVSDGFSLGSLIPKNLAKPTKESLESILEESKEKSLGDYVAKQLGYDSAEDIPFLAAEQRDALAQSFRSLNNKGGNIVADQTGVGKGRIAAAIIQWAIKNNKIPIFLTEKVGLFNDIYRDLRNIEQGALRPFMFNANGVMTYTDKDGDTKTAYKHNPTVFNEVFQRMLNGDYSDFIGPNRKFDYIALTYSQINGSDEAGAETKIDAFKKIKNSIVVADESHNAAGAAGDVTAPEKKGKKPKDVSNQMKNALKLIDKERCDGVTYLSATWAKTPENVPVYYRAFDQANLTIDEILTAFRRGDLAIQEMVVSSMANKARYIRREQSFAGVSWEKKMTDPKSEQAAAERSIADNAMSSVRKMIRLDGDISKEISSLDVEEIASTYGIEIPDEYIGGDTESGSAVASSLDTPGSPFSTVHNYINAFLAAVKADRAADRAIEMIKAGQKPVVSIQNTMESHMDTLTDGVNEGFSGTYGDILRAKINKLLTVRIKHPTKKNAVFRFKIPEEALSPEARQKIDQFRRELENTDMSSLPFSPIDYVMNKIKQAGYAVGEITGRGKYLDYGDTTDGAPKLKTRSGSETSNKGKLATLAKFNNGELDCLILNASGATGLSAHSSTDFKDQRQRTMVILQPFDDINTFMQMLGRIHRTGAVYDEKNATSKIEDKPAVYGPPMYEYIQSSLGMEERPAARLQAKMESLNANTSSKKEGRQTISDVDIYNKYGNKVTQEWLAANPQEAQELGYEDDAYKQASASQVTGRIAIMPQQTQQEFWEEVIGNYQDLISELNSTGMNDLIVPTYDKANATTVNKKQVYGEEGNPDTPPVYAEVLDMTIQGKPASYDAAVNRSAKGFFPTKEDLAERDAAFEKFIKQKEKEKAEWEKETGKTSEMNLNRVRDYAGSIKKSIAKLKPGVHAYGNLIVETQDAHERKFFMGVVVGVKLAPVSEGFAGNPWIPSKVKVTLASPSASGTLIIPASKMASGWTIQEDTSSQESAAFKGRWEQEYSKNSTKTVRKMALTGDILKAASMSSDSSVAQVQRDNGSQEFMWLANTTDGQMDIQKPVEKLTEAQFDNPPAVISSMDADADIMIAHWGKPTGTPAWQDVPKKLLEPVFNPKEYSIRIRYASPYTRLIIGDPDLAAMLDPINKDPFVKEKIGRGSFMVLRNEIPKEKMGPILKRIASLLEISNGGLTNAAQTDRGIAPPSFDKKPISDRRGGSEALGVISEYIADKTISLLESAYTWLARGSGSFVNWLKTVSASVRKFANKAWNDARKLINLNRRGAVISPAELIRLFKNAVADATKQGPLPQMAAQELVEGATEAGVELGKKIAGDRAKKSADAKLAQAKKKLADLRKQVSWNYDEKRFLLDYAQKLVVEDKAKMLRDITLASTPKKVDAAIKRIMSLIDRRLYKNAMLRFQKAIRESVKLRPEFQKMANLAPRKVSKPGLFYRMLSAMNKLIDENTALVLPPDVQAQIDILLRDRPDKISAEALDTITGALTAIRTVSNSINKTEFGGRTMKIIATAKDIENHLPTERKIADEDGNTKNWFFNVGLLQFEDLCLKLGRSGKDFIYGSIKIGERLTKKLWFAGRDSVFAVMEKHDLPRDDAKTRRWFEAEQTITTNEGQASLSRALKMSLIASLLDPSTRKEVLDSTYKVGKNKGKIKQGAGFVLEKKGTKSYHLTSQMFRKMLDGMSSAERDIVNKMRENLNGIYREEGNKAFLQLTGYEKLVKSGYWPRVRDIDPSGLNEGFKNFTPKTALEQLGVFKERSGSRSPVVIRDINQVYQNHIKKLSTFIGLALPSRNIEILLGAGRAGRTIEARFGKQFISRIQDQIQAIADLGTPGGGELNKMFSNAIRNVSTGFLGFNPRATLKQFGGLFTAATEIDIRYILSSLGAAIDKSVEAEMYEYSPILRDRYESAGAALLTPTFDTEQGMLKSDSKLEMLRDKAMSWLNAGDKAVSLIIWEAAKKELAAQDPNADTKSSEFLEAVATRAEEVVSRTQNVTSVADMSGVAIESRKSATYKALTLFQSQGNSIHNIMRRYIRRYRDGEIPLEKLLYGFALAAFGNALWSSMIGRLVTLRGWKDEKEPEENRAARLTGDVVMDVVQENVNSIYGGSLLNTFVDNVGRIVTKQPTFREGRIENPLESVINSGIRGAENGLRGMMSGDEKFRSGKNKGDKKSSAFYHRAINDILRATAPAVGVSVIPISEMKNLLDLIE